MTAPKAKAAAERSRGADRRARRAPVMRPAPWRVRLKRGAWALLAILIVAGGLYALTNTRQGTGVGAAGSSGAGRGGSGEYVYQIGSPGLGMDALPLDLPSTAGGTFSLASYKNNGPVLLYFQEGLTCQPCWDQLKAIQADAAKFQALGINTIITVTTDPLDLIRQKLKDDGITLPVLSDVGARASSAWNTNRYQMQHMGERNGHSFILVGVDGRIRWRADYGGAPNYTMFVPTDTVLSQMREGMVP